MAYKLFELKKSNKEIIELFYKWKKAEEHFNFNLDGVMREHYWFEDRVEDQLVYSLLSREWRSR